MRVISEHALGALSRLRKRLGSEGGFTMVIALGVLTVTSLLVAGTYAAVQGDTRLTQRDLDAKRAYYAARAGVNRFLYQLNQNPNEWQTCPTRSTPTPIAPGSQQKYTFRPVAANGNPNCTTSDPITTFIDADSGTFRMQFTGYAGNPEVKRGLIASFRKDTPLDYLWFTVYETLDPSTYNDPVWADANCKKFHREGRPPGCVNIVWVSGDDVNGPAYTQDQYMINGGAAPIFGRPNTTDQIESSAPGLNPQDVCTSSNCQNAVFHGTRVANAPVISPPPDNEELRTDAQVYGVEYTGMTRIVLSTAGGGQAQITRCPASGCLAPFNINIGRYPNREPIIYVNDGTGCTYSYSPYNVTYSSSFVSGGTGPATSNCGNVYVSGTYNQSVTIAADRDIIIHGNINRSGNTAVLGLVANNFVRVMHGVSGRPANADRYDCGSPPGSNTEISGQFLTNPVIHAAILAIKHSFIVDNYDCGDDNNLGELNVTGAIAQYFRGTVGTTAGTGYLKDYNYDDRLAVAQPPYLFDVASSSWHIDRETLCVPNGTAPSTAC
jgi:hypothetical protein